MKRILLLLLFVVGLALPARAASPTFSSFSTNDFRLVTGTNGLTTVYLRGSAAGGTNIFNTIIVTNLYATNIVVGGFQVILGSGAPTVTPTNSTALYLDTVPSLLYVWDSVGSVWIAVNPASASGQFTLPTVADLRLIHDNGFLQWATTRGNVVATDGQGRNYWWDPVSTSTDDGIAVIDLSEHLLGEAGRWLEQ